MRICATLGLADDPLAVYSGSLSSWYLPDAMLDFMASQAELPFLHLLTLTPHGEIPEASRRVRLLLERPDGRRLAHGLAARHFSREASVRRYDQLCRAIVARRVTA